MKELIVNLKDRSYPIYIGDDALKSVGLLAKHIRSKQVLILTNETIAPVYLRTVLKLLKEFEHGYILIPDGEQYKTLEYINKIFDYLLEKKYSRNATLIALGGGVIGDMGGFAAASYQRGIPFIQIPTTLLAQVDSSVGGKTGVNHPLGKNMIGAFYQPQCVITDTRVLDTLPDRQLSAGIAEVIKYGLIRDLTFFEWLEANMSLLLQRNKQAMAFAIEKSCLNKAEVVTEDEFESGIRATLNLGHTFGHAIEAGVGFGQILHGEAVAIGTCIAADLSHRLGLLEHTAVERIAAIYKAANLPIHPPNHMAVKTYIDLMSVDKKNIDGQIRVILINDIGNASLPVNVALPVLKQTLKHYAE